MSKWQVAMPFRIINVKEVKILFKQNKKGEILWQKNITDAQKRYERHEQIRQKKLEEYWLYNDDDEN